MTIEEMKKRLASVFRALDSVQVEGFQNVTNQAAAMSIINDILKADIKQDKQKQEKK